MHRMCNSKRVATLLPTVLLLLLLPLRVAATWQQHPPGPPAQLPRRPAAVCLGSAPHSACGTGRRRHTELPARPARAPRRTAAAARRCTATARRRSGGGCSAPGCQLPPAQRRRRQCEPPSPATGAGQGMQAGMQVCLGLCMCTASTTAGTYAGAPAARAALARLTSCGGSCDAPARTRAIHRACSSNCGKGTTFQGSPTKDRVGAAAGGKMW